MANLALRKPIEEQMKNAAAATDGQITGYTGTTGFAEFNWPGYLTVDLGGTHSVCCIRFLLWDGLGEGRGSRDNRRYQYRLLTSVDHTTWKVIYDSGNDGFNGWQVFTFSEGIECRYVRIHATWNSANPWCHIVEFEAHNNDPPALEAEITLQRTVAPESLASEVGDGLPLESRVRGIINGIEGLIESNEYLNPQPFRDLIAQLRVQVSDIGALEKSMDSVRREIISPVKGELTKSAKLGRFSFWGFWVGLIGGVLAIISLLVNIIR